MSCEHHKRCGDCFSPEAIRVRDEEIARLKAALFKQDEDDGKPYVWCLSCDSDWDADKPEWHNAHCPLYVKP